MKKRFELFEEELEYWIHDHKTNKNYGEFDLCWLTDLLNEQDEKIEKLESELNFKNRIICDEKGKVILCGDCYCLNDGVRKLLKYNRQLRQSQNSKAIEELKKVREFVVNDCGLEPVEAKARLSISKYIKKQINELRG